MNIAIEPGTYVVAVSGGVDSMALLDMLSKVPKLKLIVAHFDHGIREDSEKDRLLVQSTANQYSLSFVFDNGNLGSGASEARAREARYNFLHKVKSASDAKAIITAHHQDDVLETAIINMLRGTNRRGMSSLKNRPDIVRPLLGFTKDELIDYAKGHSIKWREDGTNSDISYMRNYVRLKILPNIAPEQKQELLKHVGRFEQLNQDIDELVNKQLASQKSLDRQWYMLLPHNVAREIMASWLRQNGVSEIDSKRLELLVRAAKTYVGGKQIDIDKNHVLEMTNTKLALTTRER